MCLPRFTLVKSAVFLAMAGAALGLVLCVGWPTSALAGGGGGNDMSVFQKMKVKRKAVRRTKRRRYTTRKSVRRSVRKPPPAPTILYSRPPSVLIPSAGDEEWSPGGTATPSATPPPIVPGTPSAVPDIPLPAPNQIAGGTPALTPPAPPVAPQPDRNGPDWNQPIPNTWLQPKPIPMPPGYQPPKQPKWDQYRSTIGPYNPNAVRTPRPILPPADMPGLRSPWAPPEQPPSPDLLNDIAGHLGNSVPGDKAKAAGNIHTILTTAYGAVDMATASNADEYAEAVDKYARSAAQSAGALKGAEAGAALSAGSSAPTGGLGALTTPAAAFTGSVIGGWAAGKVYDKTMSADVKEMARNHYAKHYAN